MDSTRSRGGGIVSLEDGFDKVEEALSVTAGVGGGWYDGGGHAHGEGDVGWSLAAEACGFESNLTTFNAAAQFLEVVRFVDVGCGKWFRVPCFVEIVVGGVHTHPGAKGLPMTGIGRLHLRLAQSP